MPSEIRTIEVVGKESSSRQTARVNAAQALARKLNHLGLVDVGDVQPEIRPIGKGRFYAVVKVQARPR